MKIYTGTFIKKQFRFLTDKHVHTSGVYTTAYIVYRSSDTDLNSLTVKNNLQNYN